MKPLALAIALCVMFSGRPLLAQPASDAADHEALRKLKTEVVNAINTRNVQSMDTLLHKPFMSTLISQDSFTDIPRLKAYFDDLFTRPVLRINKLTMEAEVDEPPARLLHSPQAAGRYVTLGTSRRSPACSAR
jgi:hypothetical protein